MKITLKNRTIFTRILRGFILILILSVIMGGILFNGMGSVSKLLNHLVNIHIPSISYSTGVERYVLRTILNEKNYLLLEKKEIQEQAMKNIQEIYANLDKVDEVAYKHDNSNLLTKSKNIRKAVEEYQEYYNQGVDLLEENQKSEFKMRMLGRKMNELSLTHTLRHKQLLKETIANGIDQAKYMEGFLLCHKIENEALQARRQEKNYLLYKNQEHFDLFKKYIANLKKLYDEKEKMDITFGHPPQIKDIRKITEEYLASAEQWLANDNELRRILVLMRDIGDNVQETSIAIQKAGWQELEDNNKNAMLKTKSTFLTSILIVVITLVIASLAALFIARGIANPIKKLIQITGRIAGGDLSQRAAVEGSGETVQLAGSFNVMTEKLQNTIKEINKEKNFSENIVATVPDSLLVVDKNLKIKIANRTFYGKFQTESEKVIGTLITDFLSDKDGRLGTELTRLFETGGMLKNFEFNYQSEKIGERVFNIIARGIIVAEEEEEEELVVLQDITERKQAEKALKESENKFRAISESAIDSIFVKDIDLKYIHVNPAMEKLFGLPASDLIGKTDSELFGEEVGKHIIEIDKKVIVGEIVIDEREKAVRGKSHSFHTIKVPLKNTEGKIIGLCGIARDITERKQVEEELAKHREHLEELVKERTKELEEKNEKLKHYNQLFEGREFRIKELKDRVKELEERLGIRED